MAGWVWVQWFSVEFSGRSWSCTRGYWEREGGHQGSPGAAAVRQGSRWTNPSFSFFWVPVKSLMWVLVSVGLMRVSVSRVLLCRRRVPRATWTRPWCPAGPTPPGILLPDLVAAWSTHHQQMGWEGFFCPWSCSLRPCRPYFCFSICLLQNVCPIRLFFWGWLSISLNQIIIGHWPHHL